MCNRFELKTTKLDALAEALGAGYDPADVEPFAARLAAAGKGRQPGDVWPSDPTWVLLVDERGHRRLERARFGLPVEQDGRRIINARGESVRRGAFGSLVPCVVAADAFYEYASLRGRRKKLPVRYHAPSGRLYLAALCTRRDGGERAFALVTTEANRIVAAVKDRTLVPLDDKALDDWLMRRDPAVLAPPCEGGLEGEIAERARDRAEQLDLRL